MSAEAFNRAEVTIERRRRSVTQGSVSVYYAGVLINCYGDDIQPCPGNSDPHDHGNGAVCFGGFHGHPDQHWIDVAARYVAAHKMPTLQEQIDAKEAELADAKEASFANFNRFAGCSKLRGKQHKIRGDAQLRRAVQLGDVERRIERELDALRQRAGQPVAKPLDLSRLPFAEFIRTSNGWYQVVKVNKATVKVVVDPGWNDLIKIAKITAIRERASEPTAPAAGTTSDGWAELVDALTEAAA